MSLYDATVPVFTKFLRQVDRWLDKAEAFADQKKFDPATLLQARLAPDAYPLVRQIQAACDQAKFGAAKLANQTPPAHPDTETTIAELRARLRSVSEYISTLPREAFEGAENRACSHLWMQGKAVRGGDYIDHVVLPNLHFHLTMAYAILRHNGIELGKGDYLGELPFIP
jgi:hypothetical protein